MDSIRTRLDAIFAILKRFRQSVLAAAVSGRLTDVPGPNLEDIGDVADVIGGLTKNLKRSQMNTTLPYLRVANVYENELRLEDVYQIGVGEKEVDRVTLKSGDVLVVEGNGSLDQIGRVAIWRDEIEDCVHQNHLIKVRANPEKVLPDFLLYYLMSPQGKSEIVAKATSGAGLYTLSISKISSIPIPVFSVDQQHAIIDRVSGLLGYAYQIESQFSDGVLRVNRLAQSVLAKAFRGELTADWREKNPDLVTAENSAKAPLERIKAEQPKLKPAKCTRRKKAVPS